MAELDYSTFSRPGQINGAGDTKAIFLKLFAGEVLASFERSTILQGKVRERTVKGQKSAQFPVTGRATAGYHLPGNEITPTTIKSNEQIITIDGLMYSTTFVDDWEDMVSHYDVRSIYANELGSTLAYNYDVHVLRRLLLAARDTATIDDADQSGGTTISSDKFRIGGTGSSADVAEQAAALADAIFQSQEAFDNAFVPEGQEKYCILRPDAYYALVKGTQDSGFSVINRDYDGAGSYSDGKVLKIGGVTILKSVNVPSTDISQSGTGEGLDYYHYGDFSQSVGTIFCSDAVGVVRLLGIGLQTDYQVERQGTLMVARQSVGIDTLRPECAVELALDTLTNA